MFNWNLDKESKIPLYLQLKNLIQNSIVDGDLMDNDQLPGVNVLADELKINFETVRKAYKELEKEKLISIKRGKGTFVTLKKNIVSVSNESINLEDSLVEKTKELIKKIIAEVKDMKRAREILNLAFDEIALERKKQHLIYAEYESAQLYEIARILEDYLEIKVKPVEINRLMNELQDYSREQSNLLGIITTGFYVNTVKETIAERPIDVHVIITNMSPQTRKKLEIDIDKHFGFICRDQETLNLLRSQLRAEFPDELKITGCSLKEEKKLINLLKSVDIVLVTPRVFDIVKKMAPPELPVINIFDNVDPMSMKVIKEKIIERWGNFHLHSD